MLSMEQHSRPPLRHFNIVLLLVCISFYSTAQIKMSYSIGGAQFEQSGKTAFTGPLLVDSRQCINVFNGIEHLSIIKTGIFASTCKLKSEVNLIMNITSFPNPFNNYINIVAENYNQLLNNDKLLVELASSDGVIVVSKYFNFSQIKAGVKLFTSMLLPGPYVLVVKSKQTKTEFIKLIKL